LTNINEKYIPLSLFLPPFDICFSSANLTSPQSQLTILLPTLRILDGQRFDAKYHDLRVKRLARPELDVTDYPTGPVIASTAVTSSMKSRKEEQRVAAAEMRARELGLVIPSLVGKIEKGKAKEIVESDQPELKKGKKSKSVVLEGGEKKVEVKKSKGEKVVTTVPTVAIKSKRERSSIGGIVGAGEEEGAPKKKKKNRHEVRREAETGDASRHAATTTTPAIVVKGLPSSTNIISEASTPATKPSKSKKRKAGESIETKQVVVEKLPKEKKAKVTKEHLEKPKVEKKKKDKNGVLSALKGDDKEIAAELAERAQVKKPVENAAPDQTKVEKVKTSVAEIVLVKKDKAGKIDVGSLLSKPKVSSMSWN
jgi:hypothetical protein